MVKKVRDWIIILLLGGQGILMIIAGIMLVETSIIGGIFVFIIGMFFLIGILIGIYDIIESRRLLKTGDKIYAAFERVTAECGAKGSRLYFINCIGEDNVTGEIKTYKSESLFINPENKIIKKNITMFPVYIDVNNREKYYVSLEELY